MPSPPPLVPRRRISESLDMADQAPDQLITGGIEVMFDCSFKLGVRRETAASAAIYYHKFYSNHSAEVYDVNLLSAAALSLAGKVEEDRIALRDLVNVFYCTLNPNSEPLDRGPVYESLCQSIASLEHILVRCLSFRVSNDLPHRYLLHQLKSLTDWLRVDEEEKALFCRTCWSLVNDFFCHSKCLEHPAAGVAVSAISLALKLHDITVPFNEDSVLTWNEALRDDVSKDKIKEIARDLIITYKQMMCKT